MKKWLSCGRFLISLEGSKRLMDAFQVRRVYCSGENKKPDAVLHIEEGSDANAKDLSEAWNLQSSDDLSEAIYCRNGRPSFSLVYRKDLHGITVRLRNRFSAYNRMGIQYGMMLSLLEQCIGLHGVTLLCGDEIVILSAPSGTGKTTLARLLETHCDAIMINGDFALLNPTNDGVIFEPTPFCGSSGRCLNRRLRINRVVFLEQAKSNVWRELSGREAITLFMNNTFVPEWDERLRMMVQENILKCISALKINAFAFAPEKQAAEIFSAQLKLNGEQSS